MTLLPRFYVWCIPRTNGPKEINKLNPYRSSRVVEGVSQLSYIVTDHQEQLTRATYTNLSGRKYHNIVNDCYVNKTDLRLECDNNDSTKRVQMKAMCLLEDKS